MTTPEYDQGDCGESGPYACMKPGEDRSCDNCGGLKGCPFVGAKGKKVGPCDCWLSVPMADDEEFICAECGRKCNCTRPDVLHGEHCVWFYRRLDSPEETDPTGQGEYFPIEVHPTCFEALDKAGGDPVFKVEEFDENIANVTIFAGVDVEMWDAIAPKIREALVAMRLGRMDNRCRKE